MNGSDTSSAAEAWKQWLSVREAAEALGITERGVRWRIQHGRLEAERDGRQWYVLLPGRLAPAAGSGNGSASGNPQVVSAALKREEGKLPSSPIRTDSALVGLVELIRDLESRNRGLAAQVTQLQRLLEAKDLELRALQGLEAAKVRRRTQNASGAFLRWFTRNRGSLSFSVGGGTGDRERAG